MKKFWDILGRDFVNFITVILAIILMVTVMVGYYKLVIPIICIIAVNYLKLIVVNDDFRNKINNNVLDEKIRAEEFNLPPQDYLGDKPFPKNWIENVFDRIFVVVFVTFFVLTLFIFIH